MMNQFIKNIRLIMLFYIAVCVAINVYNSMRVYYILLSPAPFAFKAMCTLGYTSLNLWFAYNIGGMIGYRNTHRRMR